MIIYHGSTAVIEKPIFGFGNPHNDYGRGFYCTESESLSKEWACQKNADGFANKYELDIQGLRILNLSDSSFNILHWLAILMQNRIFTPKSPLGKQNLDFLKEKFKLEYESFDVILGYRANDSYFSFASDFLENIIPLENLASSMKLGSLGLQVVLKTEKAFEQLKFIDAVRADRNAYYLKYKERDFQARKKYFDELKLAKPSEATYLLDLVRKPELLDEIHL